MTAHSISVARRACRAFCVLGLVLCASSASHAITFQTTLKPIRLSAQPGQVLTSQHHLSLDPSQPRAQFSVHVEDWWRSADGRESFYVSPGSLPRSCGSWVSVNPGEASISGGEQLSVRVTVEVPPEVRPGGYWCALTIDEVPDPLAVTPENVSVRFLASVSTAIYVSVGEIERSVRITGLAVEDGEVVLDVRNEGNAPLSVEGRIEFLRAGESSPVASVTMERQVLLTDPIPVGHYTTPLPDRETLPSGPYVVRAVIDIGLDDLIGAQRELLILRGDEVMVGDAAAPLPGR